MTTQYPLVFGAMKEELAVLRERADPRFRTQIFQTGVGKVNTAIRTARTLSGWPGHRAIFVGTAGAINPKLRVGDLVISDHTLQHDVDATPLGFAHGEVPFAERSQWSANRRLLEISVHAGNALNIPVNVGPILTGDQFIADPNHAAVLYERFGGFCADWESAAFAQACDDFNVPWVVLRIISDTSDHNSPISFQEFLPIAAQRIADLVLAIHKQQQTER